MRLEKETQSMEKHLDESLSLKRLFDIYHPIGGFKVEQTKIEKNQLSKISWEQVGKISGDMFYPSEQYQHHQAVSQNLFTSRC